ncbi:tripartite tricarboxylate transporter TctB family protein [Pseudalkalibacillus caeni]|uniref:Tripartite tricarboxylate transporter TctB family protein n=1 Tax=Exobacillus caeni TaxID=2574798 RepID=A0A5R9FDA4_9BACL|nr:tripartite tricarboxylate transporter TctB family protein [Pseudalkalibacillus caeni]TLS38544.1 tripartite tricarboxylate transporter TctB family protein [Pseudalkalibacillus caeni]
MLKSIDRKVSIVLFVFAIIYLIASYRLPAFSYSIVDADALPKGLGVLLAILSVLLFFQSPHEKPAFKLKKEEVAILLSVFGLILGYILLFEFLGFLLTTIIFLIVTSRILGYTNWKSIISVSLGFTVVLYFSFNYLLQIYLPQEYCHSRKEGLAWKH